MAPKPAKEEAPDIESTRSQVCDRVFTAATADPSLLLKFITKLTATADAMRKFSNFADALAKVASKVPLDDPEMVESLQAVIDATPSVSRKRKLADVTEDGGKKRKREKKVKDPNAPKAPPSAYIMFQNDVRNRVRAEHPGVQYKELMGLISKQWNALTQDKKQVVRFSIASVICSKNDCLSSLILIESTTQKRAMKLTWPGISPNTLGSKRAQAPKRQRRRQSQLKVSRTPQYR